MNKPNYDKLLEQTIAENNGTLPTLLLNVCCAPCLTYCLVRLLPHFDITLYYYNDNITDKEEWQKRLDEVIKLKDIVNNGNFEVQPATPLKLIVGEYDSSKFYSITKGMENMPEGGNRCYNCYNLRLQDTAQYASSNGYNYFGTTLSISPYKNSVWINAIGEQLSQTHNVKWLYSDFKKQEGYKQSIALCNKYNIYRQHYCGCEYSKPKDSND